MAFHARYLRHQLPVIAAFGRTALSALRAPKPNGSHVRPEIPGPELTLTLPPRPKELLSEFVRHVGGDPSAWRGVVPPHFMPQWGLGPAARTLAGLPYPLTRALNAGCRIEVRSQLPANEPLNVRVHLAEVDDNGRRALLRQRVVTGTASAPEALISDLYVLVPLGGGKDGKPAAPKKEPARVSGTARELAFWKLGPDAGLTFASLTGDFNPVHWIRPYARASGFKGTILHGFATLSRTWEGLGRALLAGRPDRLRVLDVKFTRPLLLPARVGLYVEGDQVFVGDAPGGPAYLTGTFQIRSEEAAHG